MSSPPPPPNPTTTTAATADFLKSMARQRPTKHSHPAIYQTFYNPQSSTSLPFPPPPSTQSNSRSQHQQPAPAGVLYHPNSGSFPPRPVSDYHPYTVNRPHGSSNSDQLANPSFASLQQTLMGGGATVASVSANPKVVGQSSVAADKNGDGAFVVIRDRKVQVSEGTSLYAQCRSWLKNGSAIEKQPQYLDCVKSLPKPLPASKAEATKDDDMETDNKTENVDHLSDKELLQMHVNRAKRVRARLRNERLQKIERYKDRLALLLPPVTEEKSKNDPAF